MTRQMRKNQLWLQLLDQLADAYEKSNELFIAERPWLSGQKTVEVKTTPERRETEQTIRQLVSAIAAIEVNP